MERIMVLRAVDFVSSSSAKAVSITARTRFLVFMGAERFERRYGSNNQNEFCEKGKV